jgi:3-oxoacyl-(acyl-carrier-protein) synthase
MAEGKTFQRPLRDLWGDEHPWANYPAGWITKRDLLISRRHGPATQLAIELAKMAIADAGWDPADLSDVGVVVGSSRGNTMGWLDPFPGRRQVSLLSVPNSLHSELASSVTIELGMHGPYHVLSSGCAAGLDALGMANLMIRGGFVKRAIAIGLDLPLTPSVLDTYCRSKMMAPVGLNDPYHPDADGMIIAEGGAAVTVEAPELAHETSRGSVSLLDYRVNSDAYSPLGMPADGAWMKQLVQESLDTVQDLDLPLTLCPHASGTKDNARSERAVLASIFGEGTSRDLPDLRIMKPWVGHCIGGSGLLELALLLSYAREGVLPPNRQGLQSPLEGVSLSSTEDPVGRRLIMKTAASMGGHNAVVIAGINL